MTHTFDREIAYPMYCNKHQEMVIRVRQLAQIGTGGRGKTGFLLLLTFLYLSLACAQPPVHYYDAVAGLSGEELLDGLHQVTKDHVSADYYSLYDHFKSTDRRPDGTVWDLYSDVPGQPPPYFYLFTSSDECGYFNGEGDCFDREHTWPKSWFGGQIYPMYSDLFIVYPADGYVNSSRSNFPYGEVGTPDQVFLAGSRLGHCTTPGYTGIAFEPIDAYKGDLARTYFYVSVRYYCEDHEWPGSAMTEGSSLSPWALAMMLRWNRTDPVSQKEVDRNNAVYPVQSNRNPFIDHPEFAERIWGTPGLVNETFRNAGSLVLFPNPAEESCYFNLPGDGPHQCPIVKIISSEGREIPAEITVQNDQVRLNIDRLAPGIYLVILIHEQYYGSGKLEKR